MVVIALLMVTGVTVMSGSAIAQDNSTSTDEESTTIIEIDERTTVEDYYFEDGEIHITLESDFARTIKLTSMYVSGSGAQEVPSKEMTISGGTNQITFDVTEWKGSKGATISTANGIVALTEVSDSGSNLPGGFTGETVVILLSTGILFGIGMVGIVAYKKQIDYSSETERIL